MREENDVKAHLVVVYRHLHEEGGVPYETRALMGALHHSAVTHITAMCALPLHHKSARTAEIIASFQRSDDFKPSTIPYSAVSLVKILRSSRPPTVVCLIGCRSWEYLGYALVARILGAYVIVFPHGLLSPLLLDIGWGGRPKTLIRRAFERIFKACISIPLLRLATTTRALSESEAAQAEALGASQTLVLSDGIDRAWIDSASQRRGFPARPIRFLYMGRPEKLQKGIDLMLQGVRASNRHGLSAELVLAGPRPDDFERIVWECLGEVPAYVRITGPVEGQTKLSLFQSCHFFLHISRFEGMAKSVREAAAFGLPIIASYESNFGDWVDKFDMGFATSANEAGANRAITTAASISEARWQEMTNGAFRYAQSHLWSAVASRLEAHIVKISYHAGSVN